FFQAEDGIRDDLVTGVQTCALPIWAALVASGRSTREEPIDLARLARADAIFLTSSISGCQPATLAGSLTSCPSGPGGADHMQTRSEERRVGKEGRSGGGE